MSRGGLRLPEGCRAIALPRRAILLSVLGTPLLSGCLPERFFDISWDEDVQLHDGSTIAVTMKFIYERLGGPIHASKYGSSILRDTSISFDAGAPSGRVTQLFRRQRPVVLDRSGAGEWFVVLQGRAPPAPGQSQPDWGPDQNGNGQRMGRLEQGSFQPANLRDLPDWVEGANMLMDYAPIEELALFDKKRVTLSVKQGYLNKYPLGSSERRIARPQRQPQR